MEWQSAASLREKFLSYWEGHGSRRYPSFSLVPDDPTLMFTIAGMVPFKPYFLGMKTPPVTRATTAQKCVRTNDIDNVGRTARHHTFFEMLGNFSFGDYFKEQVIPWAWEFLTSDVGLEPDRLYATVFTEDDEAAHMWHSLVGLPESRIFRLGEADNFWAAGPVGPCGPCSEIIYDQGPEYSCGKPDCNVGCDCDRYLEIWNLVFMQSNRDQDGVLTPLPKRNIDTGMGLERLASVVQRVPTDFETDLFRPIIDKACAMGGVQYGSSAASDMAVRVISDHLRATSFMIADGILPSNDGTGYVLRRLIRRAVRYGRLIGLDGPFLVEMLPVLEGVMGDVYGELITNRAAVRQVVELEEKRFQRTLEQGTNLLEQELGKLQSGSVLSGELAFELYDTYGFPFELTEEVSAEAGVSVDVGGFGEAMVRQKERARMSSKQSAAVMGKSVYTELADKLGKTVFTGYSATEGDSTVLAIVCDGGLVDSVSSGQEADIFLESTPFYGERGGQVGDTGTISSAAFEGRVDDTVHATGDFICHRVHAVRGELSVGDRVRASVDSSRRAEICKHHTVTHLLHQALVMTLGDHVRQAGSLVSPGSLRFDYNHFAPITPNDITKIEDIVNGCIMDCRPVSTTETDIESAKAMGAKALFEEKYGDRVRVVSVKDFSAELCGGTHVDSTGRIGLFKIHRDDGIGSGMRRIEATVGRASLRLVQDAFSVVKELTSLFNADPDALASKASGLMEENISLEKKLKATSVQAELARLDSVLFGRKRIGDVEVLLAFLEDAETDIMRQIGDGMRERFPISVSIITTSVGADRFQIVIMASDSAVAKGVHAGKLAKEIAPLIGASGGGKANTAQVGGKVSNPEEDFGEYLKNSLRTVPDIVAKQIDG